MAFFGLWRGDSQRRRVPSGQAVLVLSADALGMGMGMDGLELDDVSDLLVNQLHESYMEEEQQPRPISDEYFASLPRLRAGPKGEQCLVCLEEFAREDLAVRLPCEHVFHEMCVSEWFKLHHSCCTCRVAFPEQTEEEKRAVRDAENARRLEDAIVDSAASMAALCPGCPCAIVNTAVLQEESLRVVKDEPCRSDSIVRRDQESLEEHLFERLVAQINAIQHRGELEVFYRQSRRNSIRLSPVVQGQAQEEADSEEPISLRFGSSDETFWQTLDASEEDLRKLLEDFSVDISSCSSREDLIAVARNYFD